MKCPSCHFEQPDDHTSCEACGLIFAKYDPDAVKPRDRKASTGWNVRFITSKKETANPWLAAAICGLFSVQLFLGASGTVQVTVDLDRYGWMMYMGALILGSLTIFQVVVGIRDSLKFPRNTPGMELTGAAFLSIVSLMIQIGWIYVYCFGSRGSAGKGIDPFDAIFAFLFWSFQIFLTPVNILLFRALLQKSKKFLNPVIDP